MKESIARRIFELTETKEVQPYSRLLEYTEQKKRQSGIIINSDGSRNFTEHLVILAFRVDRSTMRSRFFYPESSRTTVSAFDMSEMKNTLFHSHNFIEFAYVAKGTLRLIVNDSIAEFNSGDICLMDRNISHAELIGDEVSLLYVSLAPETFADAMDAEKAKYNEQQYLRTLVLEKKEHYQYVRFYPIGDAKETASAISAILDEAAGMKPGATDIIKGNIIRLLHLLTREYAFRLTSDEKAQLRRRLYFDVCAYIDKYYRDVKIEYLSSRFHYNPDFFNRLIKEFSGQTYTEYLQSVRLREAERLLLSTKMSVSDVADAVGYHNLGYFYKLFYSKNGVMPKEFRSR